MIGKFLKKHNKFFLAWLFIILVTASYLRLWKISEYMTFLGDEGRDVLTVKRMIVDHDITFLGPTASVGGFFLGPIYYYFMTPFLWIWGLNPMGPAIMVALFGIATVFLVYLVGKDFFNEKVGLFAASLYALSPLIIAYSRSSWNPNIVPFFSLLYIYSLWKSVKTQNKWWFFSVGLCMGIGIQLHYLFTFLFPISLIYLSVYRENKFQIKKYVYGFLGGLIPLIPFLGFEIKNKFPNTQTIIKFIFHGEEVSYSNNVFQKLSDIIFRLFGRLIFFYPPPEQVGENPDNLHYLWFFAVVITALLSLGFILYKWHKSEEKRAYSLILLWFLFGVGMFSFYQKQIYDYYFVIMFVVPFLLVGNLFFILWKNKFLKPIVLILFSGLLLLNWSGRPFRHTPNKQLEQVKKAAEFVFEKAEKKPFNLALITGQNSDHAYRYFLEIWGNSPVTIENSQIDPERKTVTDQLLIICEIQDCKPFGNPLWEIAGFGPAEIQGEWQVGPLKILKLVHASV